MKKLLLIIIFTTNLINPSLILAKTYNKPELGISIMVDNYFSQVSQMGNIYYFTAPDNSATVIIKNQPGLKMTQVKAAARRGYNDTGIALTARGKPVNIRVNNGNGITVDVDGFIEQHKVKGNLTGFVGNNGQGFIILIASTPNKWASMRGKAHNILKSTRFNKPKMGNLIAQWRQKFSGRKVIKAATRNGGSSREHYYLCSNGRFAEDSSISAVANGGGVKVFAGVSSSSQGKWRIQTIGGKPHIILDYQNGQNIQAPLENRNGLTFIGGTRYLLGDGKQC